MKLQVFTAPTLSEALAQVKASLGPNAVIIHTRNREQRYCLGLRWRSLVEITACVGLETLISQRRRATEQVRDVPRNPARTRVPEPVTATAGRELVNTPAASSILAMDLSRQMDCLKEMVCDLGKQVRRQQTPHVPEELTDYYERLIGSQVCKQVAADVINSVHRTVRAEHLQNGSFVLDKLAEQIERMLPVAGPIVRCKTAGPHIVALVGPTGVGKTTTIAKLAADLKLKQKRRVGLITIDTYRIAAIEQLRKYAEIIGANLRVVPSADELSGALDALGDCDFVLIDTAGRSPNDTLKLGELRNFISIARADEVHLVLSATASRECAELALERFEDVRIDRLIFTKLDETQKLGNLLNIVHKVNKPLSYVTTGQDVPDDIEQAQGRRIARRILGNEP